MTRSRIRARVACTGRLVSVLALLVGSVQAGAEEQLQTDQDVERLFATVCGWCHEDGGRTQGKGPKLMGTKRSDEYMMNVIATGKQGRMPAFGQALTLEQIEGIIRYIRNLKPTGEGG